MSAVATASSQASVPRLEEAIEVARKAVSSTLDDHSDLAGRLNNLANKLESRYERTGKMEDLEEAIEAARKAVSSTPDDHPDLAACLNTLGNKLSLRYERTGKIEDLEEAIEVARKAVSSTPDDHPDLAACLNTLGNKLSLRYEGTGKIEDLEEAIELARKAVSSTPDDHPNLATSLNNLGNTLERRYKRTWKIEDLEEAVEVARKAVSSTPDNHPALAGRLNNLGTKLESRYEWTWKMEDLEEAIEVARKVVLSTPDDHPDLARWLSNLGNKLGLWYERTGKIENLEEAIEAARKAVLSTPEDHPDLAACLNNLGNKLEIRYERTGKMEDLEEAIEVARKAVSSTPDDHPDLAACLNNLGNKLERRYGRTRKIEDLEEATDNLYSAWRCATAIPFHRIAAAARCIKLLPQRSLDDAAKLGKSVIDLMPSVHINLLDRKDQQFAISTFSGVAADLSSIFLALNQPQDALYYLERGRAIIIGRLIDRRSDLSPLSQSYPEIAQRYKSLVVEVNTPRCTKHNKTEVNASKRRTEAMNELDSCIQDIRSRPGFERFLLGQTISELQDSAADGTIIIVNITSLRSDAIVISRSLVRPLRLPSLRASDAEEWLSKDWTVDRKLKKDERIQQARQKNGEFLQYLSWLWEGCVKRILEEIHGTQPPGRLPRVWWIGTGLASSMPFHAAGNHLAKPDDSAYSMAISSYVPSIKALAHARTRSRRAEKTTGPLLIATMPTTPGAPGLRGVEEERRHVEKAAGGLLPTTVLRFPTVDQVVSSSHDCSIAHFACHGYTDSEDPSDSALILQKSNESGNDVEQDMLTVHRISELDLGCAQLAYLSACSTANSRVERLSDEVLHVVSGFQVAGFPHVVGCLWPSEDWVCVEVAQEFYAKLLRAEQRWREGGVASALREAVMNLRKTEPKMPLLWAQFVHYGV